VVQFLVYSRLTARDTYGKQLEASKGRVTGLETDLETAQRSARTMEEELRGLKAEANEGDERVRRLKAQLLQVNRLIDLEREKSRHGRCGSG
jgi:chromosome segregation ATPase